MNDIYEHEMTENEEEKIEGKPMEEDVEEEGGESDVEDENPKPEWGDYRAAVIMGLIFVGTTIVGLLLSPIFADQDMQASDNEEAVVNPILYIVFIIEICAYFNIQLSKFHACL